MPHTKYHQKLVTQPRGFTLVELIVVIAILVVLSTVGFVGYSQYTASSRDGARVSDLRAIYQGIGVSVSQKGIAPAPDSPVSIYASTGVLLSLQGSVGEGVRQAIGLESGGRDPQDGVGYTYLRFKDKKSVQLLALFEAEEMGAKIAMNGDWGTWGTQSAGSRWERFALGESSVLGDTAYAATDYTDRYPSAFGKKLGVLVENGTNTPLQEVSSYTTSGVNLGLPSIATGSGILVVGNTGSGVSENLSGTWVLARVLSPASTVVAGSSGSGSWSATQTGSVVAGSGSWSATQTGSVLAYLPTTTYTAGQAFTYNGATITVTSPGFGVASTKADPASVPNDIAIWHGADIQVWAATNVGATVSGQRGGEYQWGRNDDVTDGGLVLEAYNGDFISPANTTGDNNFYISESLNEFGHSINAWDWRWGGDPNPNGGWNIDNGGDNKWPCQTGYRIPSSWPRYPVSNTYAHDWQTLWEILVSNPTLGGCTQTSYENRLPCVLKIPFNGRRDSNGTNHLNFSPHYSLWSASIQSIWTAWAITEAGISSSGNARGSAYGVRCIRN